jgi:hypothetical protein
VDGTWQDAGQLRFRAVEVEHVDHLRSYGYLFDRVGTPPTKTKCRCSIVKKRD